MTVRDELEKVMALSSVATAGPWSATNRGCYQVGGEDEGSVTADDGWRDIDDVSRITPLATQATIRGDTTYRDAIFIASVANFLRDHGPELLAMVKDAERMDWLQENPHMLYTSNDDGPIDHFVAVNERKVPRGGNVAPTVRDAIDQARAESRE
ncbi:hypothetical protein [Luteibacter yeojuensis]|uniref:Uncharacterized protein n=1 Tax=Luteibacter yeojuensis TaxID=345309 RepID=A0A7X5TP66_9GAMM|nr:hypothetical protein [Luteibacter yeojuensis]NID14389.1 hypothetical protein [Luteibacter yeojuensis]